MTPGEARSRVLAEHATLTEMLDALDERIRLFDAGESSAGAALRAQGLALFEVFAAHISLEDATLVPALRGLGDRGKRLAERLMHEHREQRELLQYLLRRLTRDERPSQVIARELAGFADYVRQDMVHEEETILTEDLLSG